MRFDVRRLMCISTEFNVTDVLNMNVRDGFKIDRPDTFAPWGITETALMSLLGGYGLRKVTQGYYALTCETLGGLKHELGFHFTPRKNGRLLELEFFRINYSDQAASYSEFQEYFERTFGEPSKTTPGDEGFPNHEWKVNGVKILHYVFDRFGPEEHMRIQKHEEV